MKAGEGAKRLHRMMALGGVLLASTVIAYTLKGEVALGLGLAASVVGILSARRFWD